MNFRTELALAPAPWQVSHADSILAIGSCFAERMGAKLIEARFPVVQNPFGVVFHPLPILELLQTAGAQGALPADSLIAEQSHWRSFLLHSRFAAASEMHLQALWQEIALRVRACLSAPQPVLILTFGTAIGYRHLDTGRVVANNHKLPAADFERKLTPLNTLAQAYTEYFAQVLAQFPHLRILLTVSPVRHTRETLPLNGASKATLRLLCHTLAEAFAPQVSYFPAYELLMDDLRDYRFYADDLIHPSAMAENYIWQKFSGSYFSEETRQLLRRWDDIQRAMAHRPLHPESEAHRLHRQRIREQLLTLAQHLPLAEVLADWE